MATTVQQEGEPAGRTVSSKSFFDLSLIIIVGIFATTLPQPQVLGRLPLTFLLKDQLHAPASRVSFFFFACGLFWYLKPIAGILTDAFPIFGTRRRGYMLISTALAAVSWLALALLPRTYNSLLLGSIIVNLFMVMASTATGAFLVEAGQSIGATGRLSSIRSFVQNACTALNGYAGGLLASVALLWSAGINAALVFSLFPITYIFLREAKARGTNKEAFSNAGRQVAIIGKASGLWWTIIFVFLFYFSPGFGTLLTYKQSDQLHFSKEYIGLLGTIAGIGGLLAAVVYAYAIKKVQIRPLLYLGIVIASLSSVIYLFYSSKTVAPVIDFTNGICFTFAEVALMDLMARSTPRGCEGLGYGLVLSVRNVALFGADFLGSTLSDKYKLPFSTMVWINTLTTLAVIVLLPFLPNAIMATRDKSSQELVAEEQEGGEFKKRTV
jgi:MFS family permease